MRKRATIALGLSVLIGVGGSAACNSDKADGKDAIHDGFESDDPRVHIPEPATAFRALDSEAVRTLSGESAQGEPDIVQVQGERLYALSPSGDLSVIALGKGEDLRVLGRIRTHAGKPLSMHLIDDGEFVLIIDSADANQLTFIATSDPDNIHEVGRFGVSGKISESWLVGNILYLVSHLRDEGTSVVTSLNVENPAAIRKVDEVRFASFLHGAAMITANRIYVASPQGKMEEGAPSTIRVIDIENSKGRLLLGATLTANGTVSSPAQMDEHEGVLRVISQRDLWGAPEPPRVETFEVSSSSKLQALTSLNLALPQKAALKSIRFDGARGYVATTPVTYDGKGALITIDLSNPEKPEQKGELSISRWIEHLEPRGDRLYALGVDNANTKGTLNVSILDVRNPSQPTILDRVEFGGTWSRLAKGQNGIHEPFQLFPEAGLMLVPFSAYVYGEPCHRHMSGVQLLDITGGTLKKGGVALSRGAAGRAFLYEDRLISVSNEQAEVFDIDEPDEPKSLASLKIGHRVDRTLPHGNHVIRLAIDPWTKAASLEIVRADDSEMLEPIGSVEIDRALAGSDDPSCGGDELHRDRFLRMFAEGNRVYVVAPRLYWQNGTQGTTVLVVDIGDATTPRIVSAKHYDFSVWHWDQTGQDGGTTLIEGGSSVVQIGHTLAALEWRREPYEQGLQNLGDTLHVLDFEDPEAPKHSTISLPEAAGHTKLHAREGAILLGHWVPVPNKPGRVRFYLDRIDIKKPGGPRLQSPVNVPGSLLSFDEESQRFVMVDYRREVLPGQTRESCNRPWHFDSKTESCTVVHRNVNLLEITDGSVAIVDSRQLVDDLWVAKVAKGDDRITLVHGERIDDIECDCEPGYYYPGYDGDSVVGKGLLVLGGARNGKLELVSPTLSDGGFSRIASSGQWLIKGRRWGLSAQIVDLRNLDRPVETEIGGFGGYVQSFAIGDRRAFFSLGEYGLRAIDLPN